ncbi:MAG: YqjF family protein [Solirubrobacteraceae bacterium]
MADRPAQPFLTACWRNLLVVTYPVDDDLLAAHAPPSVTVDRLAGRARVSFVAFEFVRTRVYGVPIPGHTRFPEINLRFYVRAGPDRGIVFIRELVPRRAVALVARARYNEPYTRIPMRVSVRPDGGRLELSHVFGPGPSTVTAEVDAAGTAPREDSDDYWLTHQAFGFGRTRRGQMRRYRVDHPVWPLHAVHNLRMDVDFGGLYGAEWAFLGDTAPGHVSFAAGSDVAVYPPA